MDIIRDKFVQFAHLERSFYQLRLLSPEGMERVRIDVNDEGPYIVEEAHLQDKSNRYYFKDMVQCKDEELYVSSLDLNVEHGEIELPFRPTLRLGMSIIKDGKRAGYIIGNYSSVKLMEKFKRFSTFSKAESWILNQNRYWLYHPDNRFTFGFQIMERQNYKVDSLYPDFAKSLNKHDGVIENAMGLFVFDTVLPFLDKGGVHPNEWKLVSFIDHGSIPCIFADRSIQAVAIMVVLVLLVWVWYLSDRIFSWRAYTETLEEESDRAKEDLFLTRFALDHTSEGFVLLNRDGTVRFMNEFYRRQLGYEIDELDDLKIYDFATVITEKNWEVEFQKIEKEKFRRVNTEHHTKFGKRIPVEISAEHFIYEEKEFLSVFCRDMTERIEYEKTLIEAKELAEESNRIKSEFLNVMSHELRTPLTAILGNLPLLVDEKELPDPEEIAEIAQEMTESGEHLLVLINDLLDLSKIEAGKMVIRKETLSQDNLVSVIDSIRGWARKCELKIIEEITPFKIEADPVRFKQIILNILSNAIKFTPANGSVTVSSVIDVNTVIISITDTGCGINPEDQEVIFDSFRQLDSSSTRKVAGSGLGLAITKKLMELHGGTISVESYPGKGSRFNMTFPL
jgi:PAS domain S-box-containing protein